MSESATSLVKTLTEEWENYLRFVYGPGPLPQGQHDQVHKAFFAGALMALKQVIHVSATLEESIACKHVESLISEAKETCERFIARDRAAKQ